MTQETTIPIPGTKLRVPPIALVAAAAGVGALVLLMKGKGAVDAAPADQAAADATGSADVMSILDDLLSQLAPQMAAVEANPASAPYRPGTTVPTPTPAPVFSPVTYAIPGGNLAYFLSEKTLTPATGNRNPTVGNIYRAGTPATTAHVARSTLLGPVVPNWIAPGQPGWRQGSSVPVPQPGTPATTAHQLGPRYAIPAVKLQY